MYAGNLKVERSVRAPASVITEICAIACAHYLAGLTGTVILSTSLSVGC